VNPRLLYWVLYWRAVKPVDKLVSQCKHTLQNRRDTRTRIPAVADKQPIALKACPHQATETATLLPKTAINCCQKRRLWQVLRQCCRFRQQIVAVSGNNLLPFSATICCLVWTGLYRRFTGGDRRCNSICRSDRRGDRLPVACSAYRGDRRSDRLRRPVAAMIAPCIHYVTEPWVCF